MALVPPYQDVLREHYRYPRNFGKLDHPSAHIRQDNPLCGDHIDLYLQFSPSQGLRDIKFHGRGCVLSQASASLMTEAVLGKTLAAVRGLINSFQAMLADSQAPEPELGVLGLFACLHEFPSRIPCALLAWQALATALADRQITSVHIS